MVAASYSEARRTMAKAIGLGRKGVQKVEKAAEGATKAVKKRGKAAIAATKSAVGAD